VGVRGVGERDVQSGRRLGQLRLKYAAAVGVRTVGGPCQGRTGSGGGAGQATVVGRGAGSVSSTAKQVPAAGRLTIRVGVVGIRSLVREDGRTRRTGRVLAAVRRRDGSHFSFRMLLVLACMSAKTLSSFCPAK
jgi:hypothetical protein